MRLGIVVVKRLRWLLNLQYALFTGSLFYWYQQDSNHWFRYEPKDDFNDEYTHQHNVVSVNWHSVVAWASFIICMSEALVTYRTWEKAYGLAHSIAKDFHASMNWAATALLVTAMILAREHKHWAGHDYTYSPHSWMGIFTCVLTGTQMVGGMAFYLAGNGELKRELLPYHKLYGIATYVTGINACLMGIIQHLSLLDCQNQYCKEHIWSDILAIEAELIVIVVFALVLTEDDGSEIPQEEHVPLKIGTNMPVNTYVSVTTE